MSNFINIINLSGYTITINIDHIVRVENICIPINANQDDPMIPSEIYCYKLSFSDKSSIYTIEPFRDMLTRAKEGEPISCDLKDRINHVAKILEKTKIISHINIFSDGA